MKKAILRLIHALEIGHLRRKTAIMRLIHILEIDNLWWTKLHSEAHSHFEYQQFATEKRRFWGFIHILKIGHLRRRKATSELIHIFEIDCCTRAKRISAIPALAHYFEILLEFSMQNTDFGALPSCGNRWFQIITICMQNRHEQQRFAQAVAGSPASKASPLHRFFVFKVKFNKPTVYNTMIALTNIYILSFDKSWHVVSPSRHDWRLFILIHAYCMKLHHIALCICYTSLQMMYSVN